MTFDAHIYETHKNAMGILLYLNRIKDKFQPETRKILVESLALNTIIYWLPVYGTTDTTLLQKVRRLKNFAAKICAKGARRSDHTTLFITQLSWLKIAKKVIFDAV